MFIVTKGIHSVRGWFWARGGTCITEPYYCRGCEGARLTVALPLQLNGQQSADIIIVTDSTHSPVPRELDSALRVRWIGGSCRVKTMDYLFFHLQCLIQCPEHNRYSIQIFISDICFFSIKEQKSQSLVNMVASQCPNWKQNLCIIIFTFKKN